MPNNAAPALQRLGDLLRYRRIELNSAWQNREVFAAAHDIAVRVVNDLENSRRFNFGPGTRARIEVAYQLAPGSLQRMAAGGPLEPAGETHRPPTQLTLVPVDDVAAERREDADQWAKMMTTLVGPELEQVKAAIKAAGPDAAGADIFPGHPALAGIWDLREVPPQVRMLFVAVWLFRRNHPVQENPAKAG